MYSKAYNDGYQAATVRMQEEYRPQQHPPQRHQPRYQYTSSKDKAKLVVKQVGTAAVKMVSNSGLKELAVKEAKKMVLGALKKKR